MNIPWFLCGWVRLEAKRAAASAILDLCMRYGIVYRHWYNDCRGETVRLEMSLRAAELFGRRCDEEGIEIRVVRRGGVPHLLWKYRRRVGLLIGTALGLLLAVASTRVLWDIRVSGNETLTTRQVLGELRASGLYVGMPLDDLDTYQKEMQIQLDSELISWVSINMSGTVAHVEIRERVATPEEAPIRPANLVARCEGIVEGLEVYTGHTVVTAGQAVQAGDLLVSGLYDSQAVGWRVTRAAGRVIARTVHEFSVEIPLKYEQKVYVGEPIRQKTLIFFEKEIKLFKTTGILGESCDKISNVDSFVRGEGVSLPFSVLTEEYFPYEYRSVTRDFARAEALAYGELERQISTALSDAELLRKSVTVTLTDDSYLLHCRVTCLENIAEVREFSVDELS